MAEQILSNSLKVIETDDQSKVAKVPGQLILEDNGRKYYDNSLGERTSADTNVVRFATMPNPDDVIVILPGDELKLEASDVGKTVQLHIPHLNEVYDSYTGDLIDASAAVKYYHATEGRSSLLGKVLSNVCEHLDASTSLSGVPSYKMIHRADNFLYCPNVDDRYVAVRLDVTRSYSSSYSDYYVRGYFETSSLDIYTLEAPAYYQFEVTEDLLTYGPETWDGVWLEQRLLNVDASLDKHTFAKHLTIVDENGDTDDVITQTSLETRLTYSDIVTVSSSIEIGSMLDDTASLPKVFSPIVNLLTNRGSSTVQILEAFKNEAAGELFLPISNPTWTEGKTIYLFTSGMTQGAAATILAVSDDGVVVTDPGIDVGAMLYVTNWDIDVDKGKLYLAYKNQFGIPTYRELSRSEIATALTATETRPVEGRVVKKYVDDTVNAAVMGAAPNTTDQVTAGSEALVTSGGVHAALADAVSTVYKPAGTFTVEFINDDAITDWVEGDVVNLANSGIIEQSDTYQDTTFDIVEVAAESRASVSGIVFTGNLPDFRALGSTFQVLLNSTTPAITATLEDPYYINGTEYVSFWISSTSAATLGLSASMTLPHTLNVRVKRAPIDVVAGDNIVYTVGGWDKLSGNIDLSGYQEKLNIVSSIAGAPSSAVPNVQAVNTRITQQVEETLAGGAMMNIVGSGSAQLLADYTFDTDVTAYPLEPAAIITLSKPAYKVMIGTLDNDTLPEAGYYWAGSSEGATISVPIFDSVASDSTFGVLELCEGGVYMTRVIKSGSVSAESVGHMNCSDIYKIIVDFHETVTVPAGTNIKIWGWPEVKTATTDAADVNAILEAIRQHQEELINSPSVPAVPGSQGSSATKYDSPDSLPTTATGGAQAVVTNAEDPTQNGLYVFVNGRWNRIPFADEVILSGDIVDATINS